MTVQEYIDKINTRYQSGITTEHSFRGDLQTLLETLLPQILVTNEPTRIKCGAPDYILTKNNIPLGYIEAKDLAAVLASKEYKEQFDRYKGSLSNLVITNYLDFEYHKDGVHVATYSIGKKEGSRVAGLPENYDAFIAFIKDFSVQQGQTIKSSAKLAEMMAHKAKMLASVIDKALDSDVKSEADSTLQDQLNAFKSILIHDITAHEFADIYAQTVAYGMFAARLHDPTLETFTRQEAAELIPKSNPFLRQLFGHIAGPNLDDRIVWIVDALADIFRATDVSALLKNFGKSTQQNDPIIHFYETFLAEYDPKLRKARGVWYTPEPVVKFIVRAVDDILKTEFGLADGLADTSKTTIEVNTQSDDKRFTDRVKRAKVDVHKVQILDPATGTATFLAEVVKYIYKQKFEGQQGIWSSYVENHLIPRLNGFELLMASYAMAHLKLDMLLTETGYKPKSNNQRLNVYLTNSLEEHHPHTGSLFANWLSGEANAANKIKRDTPVMVVMGNPPYSVSSTNKGEWIEGLIADYKKNLNERNIQPLSDDYIKFIRYGEHFINKNGEGILAYISNNSFLDGLIHRQMRKHLLETFDKIYVVDLHGNTKKKEISHNGAKDENVFDIQQGVSINLFIKTAKTKITGFGKVFHYDLYGSREYKYSLLDESHLHNLKWVELECCEPNYFFVHKNFANIGEYEEGFKIDILFHTSSNGIKTQRDDASIKFTKEECEVLANDFITLPEDELRSKYGYEDVRDWTISFAVKDLKNNPIIADKLLYRPFDVRYMNYTGQTKGVMGYPRYNVMQNLLHDNLGFIAKRGFDEGKAAPAFITKRIIDTRGWTRPGMQGAESIFPLYLYNETETLDGVSRLPNFNANIVADIAKGLGLSYTNEKETTANTFAPIDVLDYIYAVLHSPAYREKYKEFLKIDFPRVPYPTDVAKFWELVKLGGELRQIHLLESPVVSKYITQYPVDGDNTVAKPKYEDGKVWINDTQYFANVPQVAWEFYIGGYQPAQKWLKDRKDRQLSFDDILHYQKIIVALTETDRLMKAIDVVGVV